MKDLALNRREYIRGSLTPERVRENPLIMFSEWMDEALVSGDPEPTAMTLATVSPEGRPSARIVLLKGYDPSGFLFFTNYNSRKGKDLERNNHAALLFLWIELERQVRIEGRVRKAEKSISDEYFRSRPEGSRISAIISPQSEVLQDREELEKKRSEFLRSGRSNETRPNHWGGYLLEPDRMEFWQGRADRLHDRLGYRLDNGRWTREWLAP